MGTWGNPGGNSVCMWPNNPGRGATGPAFLKPGKSPLSLLHSSGGALARAFLESTGLGGAPVPTF